MVDEVGDIAVDEDLARHQVDDLIGGDAAVRASDPEQLGSLLCGQLAEETGVVVLYPARPSPIVPEQFAQRPHVVEYATERGSVGEERSRTTGGQETRGRRLTFTNRNTNIAICDSGIGMKLSEKLRYLRLVEGTLRGMGREMTQQDLARALKKEVGAGLSQSYLSQIESGARRHLTNASRMLLARFFKVHPGYLVDDPEGYHTELTSDLRAMRDRLDLWLIEGAEQFASDPEVSEALRRVAQHDDTRKCLILLGAVLDAPQLLERLSEVLKPDPGGHLRNQADKRKSLGVRP